MQRVLEDVSARVADAGWQVEWVDIPRRLNSAADATASEGVVLAARRAEEGEARPRVDTQWLLPVGCRSGNLDVCPG